MRHRTRLSSAGLLLILCSAASAGVIRFANVTDTIAVSDGTTLTTAATYEAEILFTSAVHGFGIVFNEWTNGAEDKVLVAGPNSLQGGVWPMVPDPVAATPTITLNTWHHIAMVFDGSVESLYLDGTRIATSAASGSIGNGSGLPFIGSIFRNSARQNAMLGYIDWLRISDVARYSGGSFVPPASQPASDANTQLLFYFDESPGSTTAVDQSSFHRNGVLGGSAGATSPVFSSDPVVAGTVPAMTPAALAVLVILLGGLAVYGLRKPCVSTGSN